MLVPLRKGNKLVTFQLFVCTVSSDLTQTAGTFRCDMSVNNGETAWKQQAKTHVPRVAHYRSAPLWCSQLPWDSPHKSNTSPSILLTRSGPSRSRSTTRRTKPGTR